MAYGLKGTGIERGQAQAIAKAVQSAVGAGDEDLVERADLDSTVPGGAVTLRIQAVGIVAVMAALRFPPV